MMKRFVTLGIILCMGSHFSNADSPQEKVFDTYMDSVVKAVRGENALEMYEYYGSNSVNSIFFGKEHCYKIPYFYYLITPASEYLTIRAESKSGKGGYVYDAKWEVAFHDLIDINTGSLIMDWAAGKLDEEAKRTLLDKIQWRGLNSLSVDKNDALCDIIGGVSELASDEALFHRVSEFVLSSDNDVELKNPLLSGLLANFDNFSPQLQQKILFLSKVYVAEETTPEKQAYYNIRSMLEKHSADSKPKKRCYRPN
jgi:hypothetical protein